MKDDLNGRIYLISSDIEKKLVSKINNLVDKGVNSEVSKLKKDMNKRIDNIRDDINLDIEALQQQIDEIPNKMVSEKIELDEKHLSLCIRKHHQREQENVSDIVSDFLIDCLHLRNVRTKKAVRKNRNDGKPGVIIEICENIEDKSEIMKRNNRLKNSRKYEKVYIHSDKSLETRANNNNLKALISALGVSGLRLKGSRLVTENNTESETRTDPREDREQRNRDNKVRPSRGNADRHVNRRESGYNRTPGYDRNFREEDRRDDSDWRRRNYREYESDQSQERDRYQGNRHDRDRNKRQRYDINEGHNSRYSR